MKWLIVAGIILYCAARVWAALFPRSAPARVLRRSRQRQFGLQAMSRARVLRSGAAFLLFAAACGLVFLGLRLASPGHGWMNPETPFFGALAGSLVTVGGLAALCGLSLLLWALMKSVKVQ